MAQIFISYRRNDRSVYAKRLYDQLTEHFGPAYIFIDNNDHILLGDDFVEVIENEVNTCDVLIVVIGSEWLSMENSVGQIRLNDSQDFVRREVLTALERNILVIPVLINGTSMPDEQSLPEDLRRLARLQALQLSDTHWENDISHLIKRLELVVRSLPYVQSLPQPIKPLIGREQVIEDVKEYLLQDDVRLLTLTGAPGVGKTGLALQVAHELKGKFADGVCYVSLEEVTHPGQVAAKIGSALRIQDTNSRLLINRLIDYLLHRKLLLVLDNFEQVTVASSLITDLLTACHGLTVLVTSRVLLNEEFEHEFTVEPLDRPTDLRHIPPLDELVRYPAIDLFISRAQAAQHSFMLESKDAVTIVKICHRLDGLPLAIELVAPWIRTLRLPELLEELDSLLLYGPSDDDRRLRVVFQRSYDLLEEDEQILFACLSVFAGGFTRIAVREVLNQANIPNISVLDGLRSLCEGHLIQQAPSPVTDRFVMLGILREYAWEYLKNRPERQAIQRAHANYYLRLAQSAVLKGKEQAASLQRLQTEDGNLRAALTWALETGETAMALQLSCALWRFWWIRGYLTEGREFLVATLNAGSEIPALLRIEALNGASILACAQGDYADAQMLCQQSLALAQQFEDQAGQAHALVTLGIIHVDRRQPGEGLKYLQEGEALCQHLDDWWLHAWALHNFGWAMFAQGNSEQAEKYLQKSVTLCQQHDDQWMLARSLTWLGRVTESQGKYSESLSHLERSLELCQLLEDKISETHNRLGLAQIAMRNREYGLARSHNKIRLELEEELGNKRGVAHSLQELGGIAHRQGDDVQAMALLEESLTQYQALGNESDAIGVLGLLGELAGDQGKFPQAQAYLEEKLRLCQACGDKYGEAFAHLELGQLALNYVDYLSARNHNEQRLAIEAERGNEQGIAHAQAWLGWIAHHQGDDELAVRLLEESLSKYRTLNLRDRPGECMVLSWLGKVASDQGKFPQAQAYFEEELQLYHTQGDKQNEAVVHFDLGKLAYHQRDYEVAHFHNTQRLTLEEERKNKQGIAHVHRWLGKIVCRQGNYQQASQHLQTSLKLYQEQHNPQDVADALESYADCVIAQGQYGLAVKLFGAAATIRKNTNRSLSQRELSEYDQDIADLRTQLGDAEFSAAWDEGKTTPLAQVIAWILASEG